MTGWGIVGLLLAWLVSGCSTLLPVVDGDQARGQAVLALTVEADQADYRRDWEQAEQLYRQATVQDPSQAYLWFRLGNVLMYRTRLGEARDAYREAINRDQGFAKAWNNLATAHLLEAREALGYLHRHLQPGDPAGAPIALRLTLLDEVLDQGPADIPSLSQP